MNLINFFSQYDELWFKIFKVPPLSPIKLKKSTTTTHPHPQICAPLPLKKKKQPPNLSLCIHLALLKVQESQE